jgi:hypothetical protein
MYGLLANGPVANRQISVDDPPPSVVNMQAPWPDEFDRQPPVCREVESDSAELMTTPTASSAWIGSPAPANRGSQEFAIYSYAPDLARR